MLTHSRAVLCGNLVCSCMAGNDVYSVLNALPRVAPPFPWRSSRFPCRQVAIRVVLLGVDIRVGPIHVKLIAMRSSI